MPPITNQTRDSAPYMMPMRLWSTVVSHETIPLVDSTGRRSTPGSLTGLGRTVPELPGRAGECGEGSRTIAMIRCFRERCEALRLRLQRLEVRNELFDLAVVELADDHA